MSRTPTVVPPIRVRVSNAAPVNPAGDYVLYWMIASRRARWNFALDRAVEWGKQLRKPLVIFEGLRRGFRWDSDRFRQFVADGMRNNARLVAPDAALYYSYLEPREDDGKGLLEALARRAAVVITDEFPCFFLPRMVASAAEKLPVLLEQVDSNGLLPLRATQQDFATAHSFRCFLQQTLPEHLDVFPTANPLANAAIPRPRQLAASITSRWPAATLALESSARPGVIRRATDADLSGGSKAAEVLLQQFLQEKLDFYVDARNDPDVDSTSGLSPYLHFGHISVYEIFAKLAERERWKPDRLAVRINGSRAGWWGMSESAEAFLDQIVTWRELGYNFCHTRQDYDRYESLPEWARKTLNKHAKDEREFIYTLAQFANAETHDPLWNAAQSQLVTEGRIHNYMRMLWGKKILEWTPSPREALDVMIELNNRYAYDGRDPNSYSGIFWCLGRYDRPWGPERAVFGTVRYMSSKNTARKWNTTEYIRRYAPASRKN